MTGRPQIGAEQQARLLAAFHAGMTTAQAATTVGVHRNTSLKYFSHFRAGLESIKGRETFLVKELIIAERAMRRAEKEYTSAQDRAARALENLKMARNKFERLRLGHLDND